jgi:hypothetical protein
LTLAPRSSLELENEQLRTALESRIVIEQAKGILSERFGISLDDAFGVLRRAARSSRRRLHELAKDVTATRETPPEIRQLLTSAKTRTVVDGRRPQLRDAGARSSA